MATQKPIDDSVRFRLDSKTKKNAAAFFKSRGTTISSVLRMTLIQSVKEKRMPFEEIWVPSAETLEAVAELDARKSRKAATIKELIAALHAQD